MNDSSPYPSISAIGQRIGDLSAGHIDVAFRAILAGPGVTIEKRFVRIITGEPHPFGNFACISNLTDVAGADAAIEPLINRAAPSAVLFPGPVSADVAQRLKVAGFEAHAGMPAMAVDIEKLPPTALPNGYKFVRVAGAGAREQWAEAFAAGYELPPLISTAFAGGIGADAADNSPLQYFAIVKDGVMVCTSMVLLSRGIAGIYCVATLPKERGKGLGAHVTAEPLRLVHKLGYRVGVLQASPPGHPVYRRLGFGDFGEVPLYVRMPA